jgi:hypothetical protein
MLGKIKYWLSSLHDRWQDRRLGVKTDGLIIPADTGNAAGCLAYLPLSYRSLERLFATLPVRPGVDVFIDYGSGLGRAPLFAALRPFRRVIGVELSQGLHEAALRNARAALPRLACRDVEMVLSDARAFEVPPDATVFYFFMPFDEPILGDVLDKMKASVDAHPREVTILYIKPLSGAIFIETVAQSRPWLELGAPQMLSSGIAFVRGSIRRLHLWLAGLGPIAHAAEGLLVGVA